VGQWVKYGGLLGLALASSCLFAGENEPVAPKIKDELSFPPTGGVIFQGRLGEALAVCETGRIFAPDIPDLIAPFVARQEDGTWRSEFWGKWFTSAAQAYHYQPDPRLREILDKSAQRLMATQSTNGDITTYKPESEFGGWDTWGRKYTLLGLLSYYDLTGDPATLAAARRHADYVLAHFGPGKADIVESGWWNGLAASSSLEPMVLLYRRTGDPRYLQFAEYIVASWPESKGPDLIGKALAGLPVSRMFPGPDVTVKGYMGGGSSKAYEMMSCYEGLIELYRVTGEGRYLAAARQVFASIRDTEITVIGSGSSWERWCNGRMRQVNGVPDWTENHVPEWMETCVTVYWMKLASQLLRVTGDPAYADQIELTAYNALLGAQKQDGTWYCHYSPLKGTREAADDQCDMHIDCCVANAPRGLLLLPELAVMNAASGPVVNFYEPAEAKLTLPDRQTVQLHIKSDYPRRGLVDITVNPATASKFTLSLRIPAWSYTTKVEVNGQTASSVRPGSYVRLLRKWQPGDRVRIALDLTTRLVQDPGGSGAVAITRGPIVFALDKRISKPLPGCGEGRLAADKKNVVNATLIQADLPLDIYCALDVPFIAQDGKKVSLRFCDYASAGNTWSQDSTLRVWLSQPLNLQNPFNLTNSAP